MTLDQARTLIRLSGGRVLPPVGSVTEVFQHMGGGEVAALEQGGHLRAVVHDPYATMELRYPVTGGTVSWLTSEFVLGPDGQGQPRFFVLPTELPTPCPPPDQWPRWKDGR